MTRLRQKMIEDLRLRGLSPRTGVNYIRCVAAFARFHGKSPVLLDTHEVRQFLLHLATLGRAPATRVVYHAALTFLFVHTLARPEVMVYVPRPRVRTQRPGRCLTRDEARRLLDALAGRPFDYTRLVQVLLGHASPETTARYTHVYPDAIAQTPSPYDRL